MAKYAENFILEEQKETELKDNKMGSAVVDDTVSVHSTPSMISQIDKKDDVEVGYFHLLNCDIKASEDMIRSKYLEKTKELTLNHFQ